MKITFDAADNCSDNFDSLRFLRDAEAVCRVASLTHADALVGNRLLRRVAEALRVEHDAMAKRVDAIPRENKLPEDHR